MKWLETFADLDCDCRPPFLGSDEYTKIRNELMRLSVGLITTIHCDDLRYCANNLMEMVNPTTAPFLDTSESSAVFQNT